MNSQNNREIIVKVLFFIIFYAFFLVSIGWVFFVLFTRNIPSLLSEWFLPPYLSPGASGYKSIFAILARSIFAWLWWVIILLFPSSLVMLFYKKNLRIPQYMYFLLVSVLFACTGLCLILIGGWSSCGASNIVAEVGGWLTVSHAIFWEEIGISDFENAFFNLIYLLFISILDWFVLLCLGWIISCLILKFLYPLQLSILTRNREK